jgi:hypothetical protein
MRITEVVTAPRSPWQNPYVERVIGSIRRPSEIELTVRFTSRGNLLATLAAAQIAVPMEFLVGTPSDASVYEVFANDDNI